MFASLNVSTILCIVFCIVCLISITIGNHRQNKLNSYKLRDEEFRNYLKTYLIGNNDAACKFMKEFLEAHKDTMTPDEKDKYRIMIDWLNQNDNYLRHMLTKLK